MALMRMSTFNDNTLSDGDSEPFTVIGEMEGEVLSSTSGGVFDKIKSGKDWIESKRASLKPWSRFFELRRVSLPKSAGEATGRIAQNLSTFQSNYVFICLGLVAYCVVTNPMLMFAIALCFGVWWYVSIKNNGQTVKILNREISPKEIYIALFVIAIPLFYFSAAGSTVFWLIGASLVVILTHSILLRVDSTGDGVGDIMLEEITVSP
jgi:hypothetical protein